VKPMTLDLALVYGTTRFGKRLRGPLHRPPSKRHVVCSWDAAGG
jgi:hypothetical protein